MHGVRKAASLTLLHVAVTRAAPPGPHSARQRRRSWRSAPRRPNGVGSSTRGASHSGSGPSQFSTGGAVRCASASRPTRNSSAPPPPIRWPWADLVAMTRLADSSPRSHRRRFMACGLGPCRSARCRCRGWRSAPARRAPCPASAWAARMAAAAPIHAGWGNGEVVCVRRRGAHAGHFSPWIVGAAGAGMRPRSPAPASPAPSPSTMPLRPAENGPAGVGRHRPQRRPAEPGAERQRRLPASRQRHVAATGADHVHGLAQSMGGGRAGAGEARTPAPVSRTAWRAGPPAR